MTSLSVAVAAYGSLPAATADWDLCVDSTLESCLLDAILIEQSDRRVTKLHRCWNGGWARGSVASAVVARLWPSALLDGPIAGGVGRRTLRVVSDGLSRDAVNELGRVLESGRFVTLAVVQRGPGPTEIGHWGRALALASLPMRGTALALRRAAERDEADG